MQIKPIAEVLQPAGLASPELRALAPDENNYSALLFQPDGNIEASAEGVWNRDRVLANRQFGRFLADADETQPDLVVTPEYSLPWETLTNVVKAGTLPGEGKLWALGCESIKYSELVRLKQELADYATVIFEPLQADESRFTDPLAYVFRTRTSDDQNSKLVVLVQLKTYPMGDDDHFEITGLQRGSWIYQFGTPGQSLRLVSLICSDAFAFLDQHAQAVYDRTLILHIQLNKRPRQDQYRQYRERLLRFHGFETEILCLNWARNVRVWFGGAEDQWNNISASAWYLRPERFDDRDTTLSTNHRRGLYYTWLRPLRSHALFFNFEPATFLFEATKVAHIGIAASVSRLRGPQLKKMSVWDEAKTAWIEIPNAADEFAGVVDQSGGAQAEITRVAHLCPLAAERVLALCAGKISHPDWHVVRKLDSCVIEATEIIQRVTFCQDTDPLAASFRIARLRRCGSLWSILIDAANLPPALKDLDAAFRLDWHPKAPHQNVISGKSNKRATVIYLGEDHSTAQVEEIAKKAAEYLYRHAKNQDDSLAAKQRLAVWYREDGGLKLYKPYQYVKIDQAADKSEFDLGRTS